MLIGKITNFDPTDRIAANAPASLRVKLDFYAEYHERLHGQKPTQSDLLIAMLNYVLEKDPAFQKELTANKSELDRRFRALCDEESPTKTTKPAKPSGSAV